ncbi:MAG: thiolase family protein [Halobacteriovoraceae bacterium]|nr:thiolase family protein [Halobacteriovoraceae bacterium]MCB9093993.1 thiolase family protein [Halobacteriovoraceae bacterium]
MDVYILSGKRTPQGSFLGELSDISAPKLGASAIEAAIKASGVAPDKVEQVYMGEVIQAGVGQAPARQAALFAGLPESTPCVTVNKVCGSGMQAIIDAARNILVDKKKIVVAGGMENMSLAPHLLPNTRKGQKLGDFKAKDAMVNDGLWDVYSDRHMGNCAEECVAKYNFSREEMDAFAIESFKRSQKATNEGLFKDEIAAVTINTRQGEVVIDKDEGPFKAKFDKIPSLKPAFDKSGKITAANASTLNDGAAAVVLAGEEYKDKAKFKILGWSGFAQNPTWFTTAPVEAIKNNLKNTDLSINDIDLFEINEAFAAVAMAAIKELELPHNKVNIYGGGISLGHPIGCSGARLIVTLMNAMEKTGAKRGLAALCIGGGEALSMIIERIK